MKLPKPILSFFTTDRGEIVIAQWPNWPLWFALFGYLYRYLPFPSSGPISQWSVRFLLTYWAWLELSQGVNPWRRTLGALTLVAIWGVILWGVFSRFISP